MKTHHVLLKRIILGLLTLIALAACTPAAEDTPAPKATIAVERPTPTLVVEAAATTPVTGDVMIRIYNQTNKDLVAVRVQFPKQTQEYGSLADGTSSDFHVISQAYRYAYVEVQIHDVIEVLQPIDYVGETFLAPGYYTYILRMSGGNLTLDLAEGDEPLPTEPSMEIITMFVSAETVLCDDTAPKTCLFVKFDRDAEWELFYDEIDGFYYRPGYEQVLLVYKFTYMDAPDDANTIRYELQDTWDRIVIDPELAFPTLPGTAWELSSFAGQDILSDIEITIEFTEDQLSGTVGCNHFFAAYEITKSVSGNILTIGSISNTEIACLQDTRQQEADFFEAFNSVTFYNQSIDYLFMFVGEGKGWLQFTPVVPTLEVEKSQ